MSLEKTTVQPFNLAEADDLEQDAVVESVKKQMMILTIWPNLTKMRNLFM